MDVAIVIGLSLVWSIIFWHIGMYARENGGFRLMKKLAIRSVIYRHQKVSDLIKGELLFHTKNGLVRCKNAKVEVMDNPIEDCFTVRITGEFDKEELV